MYKTFFSILFLPLFLFAQLKIGEETKFFLQTPHPYPSNGLKEEAVLSDYIYHPGASLIIGGFIAEIAGIRAILVISFTIRLITIPLFFRTEEAEKKEFYPLSKEIKAKFLHAIQVTHNLFHKN